MTAPSDTPLLPCPFCGGRAQFGQHRWAGNGKLKAHYIHCVQCNVHGYYSRNTEEKAIAAWNRRSRPPGEPQDWGQGTSTPPIDWSSNASEGVDRGCSEETKAAARECWERINALIVKGPLPGDGWDKSAERNGLVLATNVIFDLAFPEVVAAVAGEKQGSDKLRAALWLMRRAIQRDDPVTLTPSEASALLALHGEKP